MSASKRAIKSPNCPNIQFRRKRGTPFCHELKKVFQGLTKNSRLYIIDTNEPGFSFHFQINGISFCLVVRNKTVYSHSIGWAGFNSACLLVPIVRVDIYTKSNLLRLSVFGQT
ncbi:hypothetical protein SAMN05192529_1094 [Arachidicoccus rhizosphaerae]|uniref:Uncharacterized protein n=1 Tax=Arachidicoccus rhizosphaerae TaxID=551991 RepID=A0A1H3YS77_9BACT|nr:hypothetical protein [Arachidicoccus rhizosphaerae]SEA14031.1 hypothetical protein SAMN05192529_1094 [Arachidicoccus rhizosphaerae]